MAIKATVYKATLDVADLDRGYYGGHSLTLARHPSETEQRLMIRLLAFAMHAHPELEFGRGLSTADEPDLWLKDATGEIQLWVEVGLPDERRLRRAAGVARRLVLVGYGERQLEVWWRKHRDALARLSKLTLWSLPDPAAAALEMLASRNMELQCTIDGGQVAMSDRDDYVAMDLVRLQAGAAD